jgi:PEGA domain
VRAWTKAAAPWIAGAMFALSPSLLRAAPGDPPKPAGAAQPAEAAKPADAAPADAPPADDPRVKAAERKKAGDEAMDALRYADALADYSDAYAVTQDPALLYNMGRALEALNRIPEALEKLEAFDATASAELKARVPRVPKLIAEMRGRVCALTVRTNVDGARVLVRSTVIGKSPLAGPIKLLAGPADIEIEADGYFPAKKSVKLDGGSALALDFALFSRATTGVLSVTTKAAGAEVLVDDKRIGIAPVELNVTKGTHRVVVKHPDFRVFETSAVVPAGGSKSVTAILQPPSVATRWWFWTAVGAAAVAGATVAIVATKERSPDTGTIAPGQLTPTSALIHF